MVEVLGIRPARTDNHLVLIFLTIGLSIFLRGVMKLIWGKNRLAVPPLSGEVPVRVLGATILPQTLWILALTGVAIVLLVLFFRKTSLGLAMRAVAANEQAARVVGLNVGRVKALSFALAGALGGLAGCLVTPITTLAYDVGVLLGLKGFAAAILGGFGSFPGAIVGGITLGLLESLTAGYLSSAYKDVVAFVVLLLVLFVRPRGLLGGSRVSGAVLWLCLKNLFYSIILIFFLVICHMRKSQRIIPSQRIRGTPINSHPPNKS